MTITVQRLVLALLVVPVSEAAQIVGSGMHAQVLRYYSRAPVNQWQVWGPVDLLLPNLVGFVVPVLYWIFIWNKVVRWTMRRMMTTLAIAALAVCSAIAYAYVLQQSIYTRPNHVPRFSLMYPQLPLAVFLIGTTVVWLRSSAAGLAPNRTRNPHALCCPSCGYDMSTLKQSRCPECGADHTLGSLVAAQTESELAESPPATSPPARTPPPRAE